MHDNKSSTEAMILKFAAILVSMIIAVFPAIVFKTITFLIAMHIVLVVLICSYVTTWIDEKFPNDSI